MALANYTQAHMEPNEWRQLEALAHAVLDGLYDETTTPQLIQFDTWTPGGTAKRWLVKDGSEGEIFSCYSAALDWCLHWENT